VLTIAFMPLVRKSENWYSTTGRIPSSAIPTAAPVNAASEIGVSITRCSPNSSWSPAVARNAPPPLPTSSPSTTTRSSSSSADRRARRIAST